MGNSLFGEARHEEESKTPIISGNSFESGGLTPSTEEFRQYVVEEFSRSSKAIENKFVEFVHLRESELEEKFKKLKCLDDCSSSQCHLVNQNVQLRHELKLCQQATADHAKQLEKYKQEAFDLKKELKTKNEEILELKRLVDPSRNLRRKGHCIQPGDTTHEDVARVYKELFDKKNFLEPLGKKTIGERSSELTKLLRIAYSVCSEYLMEMAEKELVKLFQPPEHVFNEKERNTEHVYLAWQSRQEALSLLLSNFELKFMPDNLTEKVITKANMHKNERMQIIIKQVTQLTWNMVNLSPPITFGELTFSEDLEFYDVTDVNDLLKLGNECYSVEHRRPILFFGPLGVVGHKGSVAIQPKPDAKDKSSLTLEGIHVREEKGNKSEHSCEKLNLTSNKEDKAEMDEIKLVAVKKYTA